MEVALEVKPDGTSKGKNPERRHKKIQRLRRPERAWNAVETERIPEPGAR